MFRKRQRVITEQAQDVKEELLFGLKMKLDILSELNEVFKDDPDGVTQKQLEEMKNDIRQTLRQLTQQGTSLSEMYNRFGALFFKSKILQSQDLVNKLSNNKEKNIVDLINEDLLLERRLNSINNVQEQQRRQETQARRNQGIFISEQMQLQRQAMQNYMAQQLAQRFMGGDRGGGGGGRSGGGGGFGRNFPPFPSRHQSFNQNIQQQLGQQPMQGMIPQRPQQQAPRQQRQQQPPVTFYMQGLNASGDDQIVINDQGDIQMRPVQQQQVPAQTPMVRAKKAPKARKTKSQARQESPMIVDLPPVQNAPIMISNVKNQAMKDLSDAPETDAENSEELKEMMDVFGTKLDGGFDIQLRVAPRSPNRPAPILDVQQDTPDWQKSLISDFNALEQQISQQQVFQPQTVVLMQEYAKLAKDINTAVAVNKFHDTLNQYFNKFIENIPRTANIQKLINDRANAVNKVEDSANNNEIEIADVIDILVDIETDYLTMINRESQDVLKAQQEDQQRRKQKEDKKKQINDFESRIQNLADIGFVADALVQLRQGHKDKLVTESMHQRLLKAIVARVPQSPALQLVDEALQRRKPPYTLTNALYNNLLELAEAKAYTQSKAMLSGGDLLGTQNYAYKKYTEGALTNDQMADILNQVISNMIPNQVVNNTVNAYNNNEINLEGLNSVLITALEGQGQGIQPESPVIQPLDQEVDVSMQEEEKKEEQPRGRGRQRATSEKLPQRSKSRSKSQTDINRDKKDEVKTLVQQKQTMFALQTINKGLKNHMDYESSRRKGKSYDQAYYFDTKTKSVQTMIDLVMQEHPEYQQDYQRIIGSYKGKQLTFQLIDFFEKVVQDLKNRQPR